jgi:pimeloyl-ACP methyl ester carboxylesterase
VIAETRIGELYALTGGDGSPLVYLHGFPDHPPAARPFLDELVRRGYRVVAPWLRGYSPSPLAGPYDVDTLAGDIIALIERWSADEPVTLVGHDWGAAITYRVCQRAPQRIARAVTLALPHPLTFLRAVRTAAQLRRSWYMVLFQLPGAVAVVRARNLALIDYLWRTWSPGFVLDGTRRAALHACLAASLPAPIGYYRAIARSPRALDAAKQRIDTPLLQLHGAGDGCVLPPDDRDAFRFAARDLVIVPGAGHFLHIEQPEAIAARIDAWLTDASAVTRSSR